MKSRVAKIIFGRVLKGRGIGCRLGFPTLNLNPARAPKVLKYGVYAVSVRCGEPYKGRMPCGADAASPKGRMPCGADAASPKGRMPSSSGCGEREFKGVLHYGPRPTHGFEVSFEVHAFGLKENLYGKKIFVEIKKRIRGVKKFASEKELKEAIEKDIAAAKTVLFAMN